MNVYLSLVILALTIVGSVGRASLISDCLTRFSRPKNHQYGGISVAGNRLGDVLHNLGISESDLPRDKKAKVYSVGEGMGNLLPRLVALGYQNAKGVDVWYNDPHLAPDLARYRNRYKDNLETASAKDLANIPDGTADLILSHRLVNNIPKDVTYFLTSTIRGLKVGGEGRIYGFSQATVAPVSRFLTTNARAFSALYHGEVEFEWQQREESYDDRAPVFLLIIRKKPLS